MARLLLIQLLLFASPFVVYFAWSAVMARLRGEGFTEKQRRPLHYLFIAGCMMVLVGLFGMWLGQGRGGGEMIYIPAHVVNGQIVPGHYIPADEAGELARMDPKERAEFLSRRAAAAPPDTPDAAN